MVVNQDHYINRVFHDAGDHELTVEEFDTPYVVLAARILADPADPADLAAVHALQDQFAVRAGAQTPFAVPDYDETSFTATRHALLELARGPNCLPIMDGWNYLVRLYRPHPQVLDGTWAFPTIQAT